MRSTVWVLDPKLPRDAADGVVAALAARGVAADARDLDAGRVVVVAAPPADLPRPDGVVRAATVETHGRDAPPRPLFLELGRLTVFVFGVLVVTGAVLALSYRPSADGAFASIVDGSNAPGFGWFVRSLHGVAGHALVVLVALYVMRGFFGRRFLGPRGPATWRIAVGLGFVCIAFLVTGQSLPWNQEAYWRTVEATNALSRVPLVGAWLAEFVRGGNVVSGATVARLFVFHALLLPWIAFFLLVRGRWMHRGGGRP